LSNIDKLLFLHSLVKVADVRYWRQCAVGRSTYSSGCSSLSAWWKRLPCREVCQTRTTACRPSPVNRRLVRNPQSTNILAP